MPTDYTELNKMMALAKSKGFTVTSTVDGKHNSGSKHYRGKAMDVRTYDKTDAQIQEFMKFMRGQGYKVVDERKRPPNQAVWGGAHLHIEIVEFKPFGVDDKHYEIKENTNKNQKSIDTVFVNVDKAITAKAFIEKFNIKITEQELMDYKDNSNQIFSSYNQEQRVKYNGKASKDLIGMGAIIKVPMDKIKALPSVYSVNQTLISNRDYKTFVEKGIRNLLDNPDYKKLNLNNSDTDGNVGVVHKRINNASIWIWSKSTDFKKGSHLIDITPFFIDANIGVGENGGNFTITLPHVTYEKGLNDDYKLPLNQVLSDLYESFVIKQSTHNLENFNAKSVKAAYKDDNNELKNNEYFYKRKPSFFHNIFQSNDLVFIRFERLGTDKVYHQDKSADFLKINANDLPNNTYDMIGLIDRSSLNSVAAVSEQMVTITGRDLSKLVIEDGVYFFPVEYAVKDSEQIIQNSSKQKSGKRLIMPSQDKNTTTNVGGIQGDTQFNFDQTQSVEEWLTFLFSQLTNIDICPDNLFNGYDDKTFIISREDRAGENGDFTYKRIKANGIWQIVKLVIDKEVGDRRIADSSLSTDTGSLINLIRKICQKPFIEFFMDTYGDKYYFIVRKPPFSYKSFSTNPCINVFDGDVVSDGLDWEDEVYSWYRLEAMGSFIEQGDGAEMINLPAVMFPEYMEIFGSKVLHVQSNYLDFDMSVSDLSDSNIEAIRKQSREDMDWLIETHAYLPFTRKGTITTKGDRRIKRGMNIRYFPTGEIFHVDSVTNAGSWGDRSDRATVLQVSHGMVEEHLDKYFKLIDIHHEEQKNTWQVNQDMFKFFIQRKQFS